MNVLSLFDGISCARVALDKAGIYVGNYMASEVDPYAIEIAQKNYPYTKQVGDIQYLEHNSFGSVSFDLVIGGSPCQDLSIANGKNRKHLDGSRSKLFWDFVRLLHGVKPAYFILENVASMSITSQSIISDALQVEPIMIDAALVSAQSRKRLFWTNIPTKQPKDRGILIKDILDFEANRKWLDPKNAIKTARGIKWDTSGKGYYSQQDRAYSIEGKHPTIPTARTITKVNVLFPDGRVGVLNWDEIERLQGLPEDYTDLGIHNRSEKRGGVIGNGFNVDVIAHILKGIK